MITCFVITGQAQTDEWKIIYPGYELKPGKTRLIIKQKSMYIFNSENSSLLRSLNGGINWDLIKIPSDSTFREYFDMQFVNDSVGYLCGYDGFLYTKTEITPIVKKTTDRGSTWQTVTSGITPGSLLTHVHFFNEQVGTVFGTGEMTAPRFTTDNGGQTWTQLTNTPPEMSMIKFSSFNGNEGIASGPGNYLHLSYTTDQGSTWITRHLHGKDAPTGLKFFNNQDWVIVCNDSIYTTHNGAFSFTTRFKFPYSGCVRTFDMLDMQRGFFCTTKAIYYTSDAGQSWRLSYSNSATTLRDLRISGNQVFVSTTSDNIILKLDISELVLSTPENKKEPNGLNLYPNPSSEKLFVNAKTGEKLLEARIFDQLGKLVSVQKLNENNTIDTRNIVPGAYLVIITTSSGVYENKVIIN